MPHLHARHLVSALAGTLAVALAVGVLLSPPTGAGAFGTLGRAEATAPTAAAPVAPAPERMRYPKVDGVDLLALGYEGPDLDSVTIDALREPLPDLLMEQATELRSRLARGRAHVDGLRRAERLLFDTARSMRGDVRSTRAIRDAAAAEEQAASARLAELRTVAEQQAAVRGADPTPPPTSAPDLLAAAELLAAERHLLLAEQAHGLAHAAVVAEKDHREAHLVALDRTRRNADDMDLHVNHMVHELARAQAGMLPAGVALSDGARHQPDLPIVAVGGFRVHQAVAGPLRELLADASADGIELRGEAYRSTKRQIELRRAHCGPTDYDIFEKPSGACSPPTAKPKRSLHESGLAVDFTHGEESITSRRSPAFQWLAANAAAYGFFNLASEPWHWSVSGT